MTILFYEQLCWGWLGYWGRAGFTVGFGAGGWLYGGIAGLTSGLAGVPGAAAGEDGGCIAPGGAWGFVPGTGGFAGAGAKR